MVSRASSSRRAGRSIILPVLKTPPTTKQRRLTSPHDRPQDRGGTRPATLAPSRSPNPRGPGEFLRPTRKGPGS
jgi:hypothetical protein